MTPQQEEQGWAAAAVYELTKDRPVDDTSDDITSRTFRSGDVTLTATSHPEPEHLGITVLDVWIRDHGKVASFWAKPNQKAFEVVSWKARAAPLWISVVNFELYARHSTVAPGGVKGTLRH